LFDAATNYKMTQNFYSLIENDIMTIQGRALPFDVNDKVSMGFKTNISGNFSIALAEVDGLFSADQNIYLEDKELGIIHDLKLNPSSVKLLNLALKAYLPDFYQPNCLCDNVVH
jgi:hypothetical protein